jgi:threonylcarbamoyladenosine tRNA methylthiotransferase MtaB
MPYEFDPKNKKSRSLKLHNLSDKKKRDFYNSNLGRSEKVLFEANIQNGMMSGWTENYIKVVTKHNPSLINTIQKVKLSKINSEGIFEIEL